jgi:hypothetical protein
MAGQGILLNLAEGSVLGCIVLLQTGCVLEEVCLAGLLQIFSPELDQWRLCTRIVCHCVSAFLTLPFQEKEGSAWCLDEGVGLPLLDIWSLCAAPRPRDYLDQLS